MGEEMKETEETQEVTSPVTVPKEWSLWQRINWVRSKCVYIKKDSTIQGAGSYKAVSHDAVTAAVRDYLVQAGVLVFPNLEKSVCADSGSTTGKGVPIIRYEATYSVTFRNVERDDFYVMPVESHALDYGDKAPGKAMSYAQKYAILKMFGIETGEDDESRIEQKSAEDTKAEIQALRTERLNLAISQHMPTIKAVKHGIQEAVPLPIEGNKGQFEFQNEDLLSEAIEAWNELIEDDKRSLWVAPSKGGPFSTEERSVIKCDKWAAMYRAGL